MSNHLSYRTNRLRGPVRSTYVMMHSSSFFLSFCLRCVHYHWKKTIKGHFSTSRRSIPTYADFSLSAWSDGTLREREQWKGYRLQVILLQKRQQQQQLMLKVALCFVPIGYSCGCRHPYERRFLSVPFDCATIQEKQGITPPFCCAVNGEMRFNCNEGDGPRTDLL